MAFTSVHSHHDVCSMHSHTFYIITAIMINCRRLHVNDKVIARPRIKRGRGGLYSAIFSRQFGVSFPRRFSDIVGHSCHVSQWTRTHLRMNACHAPTATVFPEDVCRACTFRSLCVVRVRLDLCVSCVYV